MHLQLLSVAASAAIIYQDWNLLIHECTPSPVSSEDDLCLPSKTNHIQQPPLIGQPFPTQLSIFNHTNGRLHLRRDERLQNYCKSILVISHARYPVSIMCLTLSIVHKCGRGKHSHTHTHTHTHTRTATRIHTHTHTHTHG